MLETIIDRALYSIDLSEEEFQFVGHRIFNNEYFEKDLKKEIFLINNRTINVTSEFSFEIKLYIDFIEKLSSENYISNLFNLRKVIIKWIFCKK
ncbi:MAG: hypothetical protein ACP5SF_05820 [Thermoplasmata archaeon]